MIIRLDNFNLKVCIKNEKFINQYSCHHAFSKNREQICFNFCLSREIILQFKLNNIKQNLHFHGNIVMFNKH